MWTSLTVCGWCQGKSLLRRRCYRWCPRLHSGWRRWGWWGARESRSFEEWREGSSVDRGVDYGRNEADQWREVGFNRLCREGVNMVGGWFGFGWMLWFLRVENEKKYADGEHWLRCWGDGFNLGMIVEPLRARVNSLSDHMWPLGLSLATSGLQGLHLSSHVPLPGGSTTCSTFFEEKWWDETLICSNYLEHQMIRLQSNKQAQHFKYKFPGQRTKFDFCFIQNLVIFPVNVQRRKSMPSP